MLYIRDIPPSNLGLVIEFLWEIYEEFPRILKLIQGRLIKLLTHDSAEYLQMSCHPIQIYTHDRKFCEFCHAILQSRRGQMIRDFECVCVCVALARAEEFIAVINIAVSIRWCPKLTLLRGLPWT